MIEWPIIAITRFFFAFANDTAVIYRINNIEETEYTKVIRNVISWSPYNNLTLNIRKTKDLVVSVIQNGHWPSVKRLPLWFMLNNYPPPLTLNLCLVLNSPILGKIFCAFYSPHDFMHLYKITPQPPVFEGIKSYPCQHIAQANKYW